MEGPSVRIAADELCHLQEQIAVSAAGNARVRMADIQGRRLESVYSRGKQLLLDFGQFLIRVHFLMWGSYTLDVEREMSPRLELEFESETLRFYNCSVRIIVHEEMGRGYDPEIDVTGDSWNRAKALDGLRGEAGEEIADAILDQQILPGVGNIIKNEALYRAGISPLSLVGKVPDSSLESVVSECRDFSWTWYELKRRGDRLDGILKIYRKRRCPSCSSRVKRKKTGKRKRISHFCPSCQVLHI